MIVHDWFCRPCAVRIAGSYCSRCYICRGHFEESCMGSPGQPTPCFKCGREGWYDISLPIGTYRWRGVKLHHVAHRIPGPEYKGWTDCAFDASAVIEGTIRNDPNVTVTPRITFLLPR